MEIDIDSISRRIFEAASPAFHSFCIATVQKIEPFCESPIEALLGAALLVGGNLEHDFFGLPESSASTLVLAPQHKLENYRIDFCISHRRTGQKILFIECDGHDFHERTKEQAARDRKKDRKIQESGFHVLRFTGSEIYRDPIGCAEQVINFMNKNIGRILK